jgi:nitroreductase
METWDAIASRRDVRQFEDRVVDRETLVRILEAGRRAPSGRNWQPWDFVVVEDAARLRALSTVGPGASHLSGAAAAIVLVAPDFADNQADRERMRFDMGQAAMAKMIAAADLGVGSGHVAAYDQSTVRMVLGVPEDRCAYYVIDLGYPADRPLRPIQRPKRRALDDVVHWARW